MRGGGGGLESGSRGRAGAQVLLRARLQQMHTLAFAFRRRPRQWSEVVALRTGTSKELLVPKNWYGLRSRGVKVYKV